MVSPYILIRRERAHGGGVCACSEVKLNRMGQAVQTACRERDRGEERRGGGHLAQLVLSQKRLELPLKVEAEVTFLAQTTC